MGDYRYVSEWGGCMAWNDKAKIACDFSFRCPKSWERLSSTDNPGIHHCSECDRDVHLALTEEDFRRHADEGQCVAVRVIQPGFSAAEGRGVIVMGEPSTSYGSSLKRV